MNARQPKPIVHLDTHDQATVTARQVCDFLQVDHRTMRKWIEGGYLKAMRLPGHKREWRIEIDALRTFVRQQHLEPSTHTAT